MPRCIAACFPSECNASSLPSCSSSWNSAHDAFVLVGTPTNVMQYQGQNYDEASSGVGVKRALGSDIDVADAQPAAMYNYAVGQQQQQQQQAPSRFKRRDNKKHNLEESRRRQRIRDQFAELRDAIGCPNTEREKILRSAIDKIRFLTEQHGGTMDDITAEFMRNKAAADPDLQAAKLASNVAASAAAEDSTEDALNNFVNPPGDLVAQVGLAVTALDGRFTHCNEHFAEMTGYTREQITQSTFFMLTHLDHLGPACNMLQNLLSNIGRKLHIPQEQDSMWIRKNGGFIPVHITAFTMATKSNYTIPQSLGFIVVPRTPVQGTGMPSNPATAMMGMGLGLPGMTAGSSAMSVGGVMVGPGQFSMQQQPGVSSQMSSVAASSSDQQSQERRLLEQLQHNQMSQLQQQQQLQQQARQQPQSQQKQQTRQEAHDPDHQRQVLQVADEEDISEQQERLQQQILAAEQAIKQETKGSNAAEEEASS